MSEAKFTPRPWKFSPAEYPDWGGYIEPRVFSVADPDCPNFICSMAVRNGETETANGLLVAAAPDMYEALRELLDATGEVEFGSAKMFAVLKANAALAKAEGRPWWRRGFYRVRLR